MAYRNDIFLSYRRNEETRHWIERHFEPLLKLRVGLELGREPVVFIDQRIESGTSWPLELATELASSRVLVALWTKTYFNSKWCVEELSHILARERETSRRTPDHPRGLVIPAIIHDGEDFPPGLKHIQHFQIQRCFNVRMTENSPRAEELDEIMIHESPAIAKAIESAPGWQSEWSTQTARDFYNVYHEVEAPSQIRFPTFAVQ